jgi:hypothetical protein
VKLTTHLHLVPRSKNEWRAIPPLPQYAFMVWCSVEAQGQLYFYLLPFSARLSFYSFLYFSQSLFISFSTFLSLSHILSAFLSHCMFLSLFISFHLVCCFVSLFMFFHSAPPPHPHLHSATPVYVYLCLCSCRVYWPCFLPLVRH